MTITDATMELVSGLPRLPSAYTNLDRWRDFQAVLMADVRGKRVLVQLIHICGTYRMADAWPGSQAEKTLQHEGARKVGLDILNILINQPVDPTHDPDRLPT